ncbi:unnamed protein product [Didymodactylos carnosus]|uniref:Uncharacterized protein n=1 Tax=Didymodactylos carnosus TaxID=1234261 RepID=A0A814NGD3_9BILA|nr:unnamed protein product [Didymodactylos carnosus]CAF1093233.1 unnamed protein product [Didymodactylos carnosus]CAF3767018.1 unnamed protein product [Didymodactylos carnosus]CAF3858674.1 unnamed protein product [Didymodactylos carnosus]
MYQFPGVVVGKASLLPLFNDNDQVSIAFVDSKNSDNDDLIKDIKTLLSDDNLKIFSDLCLFIHYIVNNDGQKLILLILSSDVAKQIISIIHDRLEIISIYIYCKDEPQKQKWIAKNYSKTINKIFTDKILLMKHLDDYRSNCANVNKKRPLRSLCCFRRQENNSIRNLSKQSTEFIWFQLIIEILLRMPFTKDTKDIMIKACLDYYHDNEIEKKNILDFESTFCSEHAIRWYTRPCFCPRLTNKVRGTQDPDCLFTFRFIITEIHNQIYSLHQHNLTQQVPTVIYRGKVISTMTLKTLKNNINGLVSINGFLSATREESVADMYSGKGATVPFGYERVLFKLCIIRKIEDKILIQPYASIKQFSHIPDEDEILFSVGTMWRITSIEQDKYDVWNVDLLLASEDDECRIELTQYLKEQLGEKSTLLMFGKFLSEIGEYKKADKYYKILLNELPEHHEDLGPIYNDLGCLRLGQDEYHLAEEYFKKAMDYCTKSTNTNKDNPSLPISIYNHAIVAKQCNKTLQSSSTSSSLQNTIELITKSLSSSNTSLMHKLLNNDGLANYQNGKYAEALDKFQQALNESERKQMYYPPDLSTIYNNIAAAYFKCRRYQEALEYFQQAIRTGLTFWLPNHSSILDYTNNKGIVLKYLATERE